MRRFVSLGAVAAAVVLGSLASTVPANASLPPDKVNVCNGSGSCTTVSVPCSPAGRHTKNVSKPYSDQAEFYVFVTHYCPAKLFTGSNGTGNGLLLLDDGNGHSLAGTHQWHDAYSVAAYGVN